MQKEIYRQGDVMIVRTIETPVCGKEIKRDNGRVILAYGEVTGHAHAIYDTGVEMYTLDNRVWVVAPDEFTVQHEEHDTLTIPAGTYWIVRQREYTPSAIRQVLD